MSFKNLGSLLTRMAFDGGYKIDSVTGSDDKPLRHTVVGTMMRVDLDDPLLTGQSTEIKIAYSYNILNADLMRARSGYEFFEKDGNYIYEIAQWFPRVASYTDYTGWQHKQFLGRGEFTLELGDYLVRITVPEDMVVAATGVLTNQDEVLDSRLEGTSRQGEGSQATDVHHHSRGGEAERVERRQSEAGNENLGVSGRECT